MASSSNNAGSELNDLFDIKTYFYIGAYQQCLMEINKLSRVNSYAKDFYMWRAYLAQGKYSVILDGIKETPDKKHDPLQALRKFTKYHQEPQKRTEILQYFDDELLTIDDENIDEEKKLLWSIIVAAVYYNEGLYENVLKVLRDQQKDLECLALQLQSVLKMNRLDLARKILAKMQDSNDDATLTQLALAWMNIELGGEKFQDAYYIFQDLSEKFISTNVLLNGQAVCFLGQEKYETALEILQSSLDKDANNYDTLVNFIVLSEQRDNSIDVINRYLSQIKGSYKHRALVDDLLKKENEFDRLCMKYEPTISTIVN